MKKNLNKLATLALTGILMTGMSFGSLAAVEDGKIQIDKVLKTDGKTYAPNTTFNLTVSEGTVGENDIELTTTDGSKETLHSYDLKAGSADLATDINEANENNGATYSAQTDGILKSDTWTKKITLDLNTMLTGGHKVSTPGIYVFSVAESDVAYEGVEKGEAPTQMMVAVNYKADNTAELEISSVVFANSENKKVTSLENYYGSEENDKVYDLTVSKNITGVGSNQSAEFDFKVKVSPADGYSAEKYSYWYEKDGVEQTADMHTLAAGEEDSTIKLSKTKAIHIYGLTEGDVVEVTEVKAGQDGYTTKYTVTGVADEQEQTDKTMAGTVSVNVKQNNATFAVTNSKERIPVTGVVMNIAPYAAMILGAGAFAGVFLGRKKSEDEK